MRRSLFIDPVLFLLVAALLSIFSVRCSSPKAKEQPYQGSEGRPVDLAATRERIARLRQQVDQQRANAVAAKVYTPKTAERIDDLAASASDILHQLPGVFQVETFAPADRPTRRIVHLRDWHFVRKDLYTLDLRTASKTLQTDTEIDALHEELTLQVELVQLEKLALLRCLIRHHGLRRIHVEGMMKKDLAALPAKIAALRKAEKQVPTLEGQFAEVRQLRKEMEANGRESTERHRQTGEIEQEIVGLLGQHWLDLLELGALGRLGS